MYRTLTSEAEATDLIISDRPAWLLKHSNICPISSAALDAFTSYLEAHPDELAGMLVVQEQRPLSNWVAERLRYTHQSPQLFLVRHGQVMWHASHWDITAEAMQEAATHTSTRLAAIRR